MGTRGLRPPTVIYLISVYRCRGKFSTAYNHSDSYPDGLGRTMVNSIPHDPSVYKTWLEEMRTEYDSPDSDGRETRETRPLPDLFLEYVYEVDLDDEVFWLNGVPLFRLDCMPTAAGFIKALGRDHYGHYVTKESMPAKHAYQIAPPTTQTPNDEDVASYTSFLKHPSAASPVDTDIHELLGVSEDPSPVERIRIGLYEVIIGALMGSLDFVSPLLASQVTRAQPTHQPWIAQTVKELVVRAFLPMVFQSDVELSVEKRVAELEDKSGAGGLLWLTSDVCFGVGFHLDYDDHLRASIGKMVRAIRETFQAEGIVYGVLCSVFHIVIVKVDTASGGSFQHTPALQFLPSRFAESPSTPGITALLRLTFRHDSTLCETVLNSSPFKREPQVESPTCLDRLPAELVTRIASFIPDLKSLLSFATLSDRTKARASPEFRFPFIGPYRLLGLPVAEGQGQDQRSVSERLKARIFRAKDVDGRSLPLQTSGRRLVRMSWDVETRSDCFGIFTHDSSKATFVLQTKEMQPWR
ncbi:hypothetical protein PLEOSDRAFT_1084820 [Pleurotus ostreatus PC15]|uniref:F-box domain-containing protein n=1 Tax=Pleurotus ostreatus (strain PC15) TaxID=1137138 RepID=A0A067NNH2_PLEO1|nr:hypothetical protein PLEOSDRAFT_1084820 [Pleurotus ostreatus PC15]